MSVDPRPGSSYFWYDFSIDGQRFRGSTKKKTRAEARLVEAELYQQAKRQIQAPAAWRLRDVLGAYWSEHGANLTSHSTIFFHFEMLSEFLGADTPILDLTNAKLLDYRAARRGGRVLLPSESIEARPKAWRSRYVAEVWQPGRPGRIKPVKPQSVNRDLAHFQAAMNWAADVHGKPVPALAWKRLKVAEPEHRIRFADGEEFARLIECAHADLRPILLVAVTTGLRRSAILRLEWHQVSLSSGTITIPRSKGRKPLVVQIAPAVRAALARTAPKDRKGRVFDVTNWRRRWAAALKDAEMVDFHFHDLRHTFASWARLNGADIADICDALAHSAVSVTMRYAHLKPGTTTTAFDRVAALLGAADAAGAKRA